jgi:4-carboxymuconolactone decarboxylase
MSGRAERGRMLRERAQGPKAKSIAAWVEAVDEDVAGWADEFVFGTLWDRPGLSFEERFLVVVSILASGGHTMQLKNYLHGALAAGIDEPKLREALVMLTAYAGFPTATTMLGVLHDVLTERAQNAAPGDR